MTPHVLIGGYRRFRGTCTFHLDGRISVLRRLRRTWEDNIEMDLEEA
jgi:hypothetical protein